MTRPLNLDRFVEAQEKVYAAALQEVKNGIKTSHWMWFIFPQISGLGRSDISKFYAIKDLEEAAQYLAHPLLGNRLIEISSQLLLLETNNAMEVFGSIDGQKLQSCMTLFSVLEPTDPVFKNILQKFFNGKNDTNTLTLLYR